MYCISMNDYFFDEAIKSGMRNGIEEAEVTKSKYSSGNITYKNTRGPIY